MTNQEKGLFLLELARKYLSDEEVKLADKVVEDRAKAPEETPKNGPKETWKLHSSRGRVPDWVFESTGVNSKKELKDIFGTVAVFTKGGKLPPKMGS